MQKNEQGFSLKERRITMTNSEKALALHKEWNGKIETTPKCEVKSREDLALAYTPGVAEPCKVIAEDKEAALKQALELIEYTIKSNTVAVVSDGSAVLGLGNIGAAAAMPVMEGKAVLFKEFGNVNAFPICLDTQDTEEIIKTVVNIAPAFGGINLEDISAPRCFEIESRLKELRRTCRHYQRVKSYRKEKRGLQNRGKRCRFCRYRDQQTSSPLRFPKSHSLRQIGYLK